MTRSLRSVPAADNFATVEIPVIDGELDETTEIPLIQLRPEVPEPRRQPVQTARRGVELRRYGWLIGLVLAGVLVYAPVLAQGLLQTAGWVLVVAVIWTVVVAPLALVIGLGIRLADQGRGGHQ